MVGTGIRKAGDLGPGFSGIQASPEAVSAAGSQVKDARVVWVNRQALAHTAAGHVTADFEGQVKPLERAALIFGAEDCAILARPFIGIGSYSEIHAIWIARIDGDALDPAEVPVGESDEIEQRNPAARILIEPVCAAEIGPRIHQA